jgi:hypothetical protein
MHRRDPFDPHFPSRVDVRPDFDPFGLQVSAMRLPEFSRGVLPFFVHKKNLAHSKMGQRAFGSGVSGFLALPQSCAVASLSEPGQIVAARKLLDTQVFVPR